MGGRAPKGILTDQCASMQRTIETCMPTTIYRWCIWHIMNKIPSKSNGYKRHEKIEHTMSHVVWNSLTKESFDRNWNDFLMKYGIGDNKWFSNRHLWISVYFDHHFWVEMRSTQRSESMHDFFNKFIMRNNSHIQFVKQYDNCLGKRERESDTADFHTVIPCTTKFSIEAHFNSLSTIQKKGELHHKINALRFRLYISNSTFNKFTVTYDKVAAEVKWQCLLFESRGILYCHSLSALSFERSKNIKRRHTHIKSSHNKPLLEPKSKRFDNLIFQSQNICEFASESEGLTASKKKKKRIQLLSEF
ncbi:hypothetical protein Ahy_A07g034248 [Arachis hypogaea]|uniref:Protein FAR1-RELATED SEQUENCE n=1 Tax=Arachis hypogaea TaxID=3818 RepID=A0A445CBC2_ARAHY|nr:hypothetical protein Ahy_A07g034248 [Arachis hypogaea]